MPDPTEAVRLLRAIVEGYERWLSDEADDAFAAVERPVLLARLWLLRQPASEEAAQ